MKPSFACAVPLLLVACGGHTPPGNESSEPAPSSVGGTPPGGARSRCLDSKVAIDGSAPTAPRHALACTLREFDRLGSVARVTRTFDGAERVTSERFERLDDPPRTTVHDYAYAPEPRKNLRVVEYDGRDHMIRETIDNGIDGTLDRARRWTFDAKGRETIAEDRSGSATRTDAKTYDTAGFLTLEQWLVDGAPSASTTWARRADGAPLVSRHFESPGVLGSTTTWSYDAIGHPRTMEVMGSSGGKALETTTYDAAGRISEVHSGWSATDDAIRRFSYDANGNVLRDHRFDTSGRDIEDRVATYDAHGRMLTDWHKWGFGFVDGFEVDFETRTLDACGVLVSSTLSRRGNLASTVANTYDDTGHLIDSERVNHADNKFGPKGSASRWHSVFDAAGHLTAVRTESREGTQWKPSSERRRAFDAAGHLILEQLVTFPSGSSSRETWTFDAAGDLIGHQSDAGHGVREELDYECFSAK